MMNNNKKILTDLKKYLFKNYEKPVKDVILFGSH